MPWLEISREVDDRRLVDVDHDEVVELPEEMVNIDER